MILRLFITLPFLFLSSCSLFLPPTETPVRILELGKSSSKELVVLLPGRFSKPEDFTTEGFTEKIRAAYPNARIVAPDLHLGYYKEKSAPDRLHEDIILPAKADKVTLIGISMGGLGALLYDIRHPGNADDLILLSPFAGKEKVITEITEAGLENWQPQNVKESDYSRKLWQRLRTRWSNPNVRPNIFLACGTEDRLITTSRLLGEHFVPTENTYFAPGDHDWPTWRDQLDKALAR